MLSDDVFGVAIRADEVGEPFNLKFGIEISSITFFSSSSAFNFDSCRPFFPSKDILCTGVVDSGSESEFEEDPDVDKAF